MTKIPSTSRDSASEIRQLKFDSRMVFDKMQAIISGYYSEETLQKPSDAIANEILDVFEGLSNSLDLVTNNYSILDGIHRLIYSVSTIEGQNDEDLLASLNNAGQNAKSIQKSLILHVAQMRWYCRRLARTRIKIKGKYCSTQAKKEHLKREYQASQGLFSYVTSLVRSSQDSRTTRIQNLAEELDRFSKALEAFENFESWISEVTSWWVKLETSFATSASEVAKLQKNPFFRAAVEILDEEFLKVKNDFLECKATMTHIQDQYPAIREALLRSNSDGRISPS